MRLSEDNRKPGGIALIIVMISVFVLMILAGGFAYSMKVETRLAMHANDEAELMWIGRSGVEYCRWILALQMQCPNEPYDALNQIWAGGPGGPCATNGAMSEIQQEVKVGRGSFTWKISDTERKWNINTAPETILQQALLLMGVDAGSVAPVVASILDWIDPDDGRHPGGGVESDFYEKLDPPYFAKNGPIDDISELLLINGISPEIYWAAQSTNNPPGALQEKLKKHNALQQQQPPLLTVGLVDLFTPLSSGRLNINTASAEALQLIPGMNEILAQQFVAARTGDFDPMTGMGGPFLNTQPQYLWGRVPGLTLEVGRQLQTFADVRSRTFEAEITARVGTSTRTYYATIVRGSPRDLPVVNFYWRM
jgi:general secretion pathway protein K